MFQVNSLRVICSFRILQHSHRLRTSLSTSVTCLGHSVSSRTYKDTWHDNICFKTLGKENELSNSKKTFLSRSLFSSQVKLNCWNCEQVLLKTPAFFCNSCKIIQPPEEGVSFFKIMDCDQTFALDTQKLQSRYLQLQRSLHPDNFSQKSSKEREFSESQSALVNKAYKTLLKPLSRGLYMLELQGMSLGEGTDSQADSDFLMELMEINEALDEAQTPEEADKIGRETKGKLADLTEQIDAALRKGELQTAKTLLAKMKYHANIEEKVKEKLSAFM